MSDASERKDQDPNDLEWSWGEEVPVRWWVHILLFLAACGTTLLAGIVFAEGDPFALETWKDGALIMRGASFSVAVMAIIFAHEMGHYLWALKHKVPVSPPYFLPGLPIPFVGVIPLMGTFGAFIRMELRPLGAKKLLDIGAWGPLAGFIVTVPILLLGYSLSDVRPLPAETDVEGVMRLGDTLLLLIGEAIFFPDIPEGHDVFLHPVAMAGWTGGFLTAFNLLPIGQLDGGHIAYSVFGERFNRVAPYFFYALIVAGVVGFPGWLLLALLLWRMRPEHPNIIRGEFVRGKDLWLAIASLVMFILTFTPQPIVGPTLLDGLLQYFR